MRKGVETVEERARKVDEKLKAIAAERFTTRIASNRSYNDTNAQRGVLPLLSKKYPNWYGWYDPQKTLVWGAPPVDNIGRIGELTK
jgi:cytochrome c oxidase assembly factor 3